MTKGQGRKNASECMAGRKRREKGGAMQREENTLKKGIRRKTKRKQRRALARK